MDVESALIWGFGATVVLTLILRGAQALGLTRMDLPFMLGAMFTPDRDLAKVIGVLVHIVNGWIFAFIYAGALETSNIPGWSLGPVIGLVHGTFVASVGMPALPGMHPRMASEGWGPEPTRQLEPPGFLALNYGRSTPLVTILAHIVYGAILGAFY